MPRLPSKLKAYNYAERIRARLPGRLQRARMSEGAIVRVTGNSEDGRMPICAMMPVVVRKERQARGVSQYVLAKNGGISREMIRLVEKGSSVPSLETLARICEVLKMPMSELVIKVPGPAGAQVAQANSCVPDRWPPRR